MKKIISILLPLFILTQSHILNAAYFHIEKYNVNVIVNNDSSAYFEENILVNFHTNRHGIYRFIPFKWGKYHFRIKLLSVESSNNGEIFHSEKYKKWEKKGWFYIKIGKKNKTYKGLKYYKIVYKISNAVINNVFYWNVIGAGWKVPIKKASATIQFPKVYNLNLLKVYVFKGLYSKTQKIDYDISNFTLDIKNISLKPREAVTVKLIFPSGLIKPISPYKRFLWRISDNLVYIIPFFILIVLFFIWLKIGKDEKTGSIVVRYEPPEDYTPAEVGTLIDDRVDSKDIAATIIDLARKGYMNIKKHSEKILFFKKNDFVLERTDKAISGLKSYEINLLEGIFNGKKSVSLKELKSEFRKNFQQTVKNFKDEMAVYLTNKDHLYVVNPRVVRKIFLIVGGLVAWVSIFMGKFFYKGEIVWAGIISGIIIILFSFIMPKKSHKGTKIYKHILGFKEFLKKVEKDKLEKLSEDDPDIFNKMLPYAIALGVEKHWAKKFEGIDINAPVWYAGYYTETGGFSADDFVSSIQSDINSLTSAVSSTVSSGTAGGGGGGGGGGSW